MTSRAPDRGPTAFASIARSRPGVVFDIQGFSVHDGPGCRTVVFLKGCPLECRWCANPEGMRRHPAPLLRVEACDRCNRCADACERGAIAIDAERLLIDRDACSGCMAFRCAEVCSSGALQIAGQSMDVEAVIRILQRDRRYWGGDGGVTLTGGEPLLQREFAIALLQRCCETYIDTAVETAGHVAWAVYEECLPYLDWIFFDIKHVDAARHAAWTGRSNGLILDNARRLAARFSGRLIFRTPIVPGFNDTGEDLTRIAAFIAALPRETHEVNLLPLHHLGREKYRKLGAPYFAPDCDVCAPDDLARAAAIFRAAGISCYVAGDTPF